MGNGRGTVVFSAKKCIYPKKKNIRNKTSTSTKFSCPLGKDHPIYKILRFG
jgi:hypothetical protein